MEKPSRPAYLGRARRLSRLVAECVVAMASLVLWKSSEGEGPRAPLVGEDVLGHVRLGVEDSVERVDLLNHHLGAVVQNHVLTTQRGGG
jgi:hypothetical protein